MERKYVSFVSDEHLLRCVKTLHESYTRAKTNLTKKTFYENKIDTIKLTFDSKFNDLSESDLVQAEVLRQIDKSINNAIGAFHEQVLGGIEGFESGIKQGYDVKATNDTLFADIKNKHNTASSSALEALFQRLARLADDHKQARCYWVQVLAKNSFHTLWKGTINGKEYSHSRVYKISGDHFYGLLSGEEGAFKELYAALPRAIEDYMNTSGAERVESKNSAFEEIEFGAREVGRSILDQITFENYPYYFGFGGMNNGEQEELTCG